MLEKFSEGLQQAELDTPEIQVRFEELISFLQIYLGLDILYKKVEILFDEDVKEGDVFSIGVKREIFKHDRVINIHFSRNHQKFFPQILLREAFLLFIPSELYQNEEVGIIISKIVENELKFLDHTKWKGKIENSVIDAEYIKNCYDGISKFVEISKDPNTRMISFIFRFLRENYDVIDEIGGIFNRIQIDFINLYKEKEYPDYVVETLYCLAHIFFEIKSYRAQKDYKEYFKKFKKEGVISTDLSLRNFIRGIDWIEDTGIATSYSMDWRAFNIISLETFIRFNPCVPSSLIRTLIKELPFFDITKLSEDNFSKFVHGFFVIPGVYIDGLRLYLQRLEDRGIIEHKTVSPYSIQHNNVNMNYLRPYYIMDTIIDPERRKYEKKYEIKMEISKREKLEDKKLDLLELFLLTRIQMFSYLGLPFESRAENVKKLQKDLKNYTIAKLSDLKELENLFEDLSMDADFNRVLNAYIERAKLSGVVTTYSRVKSLLEVLPYIPKIVERVKKKVKFAKIKDVLEYIDQNGISNNITKNNILKQQDNKEWIVKNFIPRALRSPQESSKLLKLLKKVQDFFRVCLEMKIYDIKAIQLIAKDENIRKKIIEKKKDVFRGIRKDRRIENLSGDSLEQLIEEYSKSEKPLIFPAFVTTFNMKSRGNLFLIAKIKYSKSNWKKVEGLLSYFPRIIMLDSQDLFSKQRYIKTEIYSPNMSNYEKYLLVSALYVIFGDDLYFFKRFFYDGTIDMYKFRSYYDDKNGDFFYQKDLFKEFFSFTYSLMEDYFTSSINKQLGRIVCRKKTTFQDLVSAVRTRTANERLLFSPADTYGLTQFRDNLKTYLADESELGKVIEEGDYNNLIDSVHFHPNFAKFGLSQFFFYFVPYDAKEIDFRLLLLNNLKEFLTPPYIDRMNTFFISQIFPFDEFNFPYFNWLNKSLHAFKEYCIFKVEKVHTILQFDKNVSNTGWNISTTSFKLHRNSVVLKGKHRVEKSYVRSYNMAEKTETRYGPESEEYAALKDLYYFEDIDLKTNLRFSTRKNIKEKIGLLLKKDLIFPYMLYKNLALLDEIMLVIPELKDEIVPKLIDIFAFFNIVYIYEGTTQYFIAGCKEKKNEKGLIIKIMLPKAHTQDIIKHIQDVLEYFEIDHYFILHDLITNYGILNHIFDKDIDFANFSPLNLEWNAKDKKWMNHRPLGENFEKFYPDLPE